MNIRCATLQDAPSITLLWQETNLTVPWNNPEEDIKRALSTATSTLLVAESNGKIIGTVMAGYEGHRGWIYYLAVIPSAQGKGYGKQLLAVAEEWLKRQGAPKVHLLIRKNNEAVQRFYASSGYETSDVLVMGKKL